MLLHYYRIIAMSNQVVNRYFAIFLRRLRSGLLAPRAPVGYAKPPRVAPAPKKTAKKHGRALDLRLFGR